MRRAFALLTPMVLVVSLLAPPAGSRNGSVSWSTPVVDLSATSLTVTANDLTFEPADHQVNVRSDPGSPTYWTLETIWHEQSPEMRVFLYFRTDGWRWWISEIRTYDGHDPGEWIACQEGLPHGVLGRTFTGDLHVERPARGARLDIVGMSLAVHPRAWPTRAAWPQYGADPQRTGVAPSSTITSSSVRRLDLVWSRALGSNGGGGSLTDLPAGLVVANDTVFVSGRDGLNALDARSGAIRWRLRGGALRRGIGSGELAAAGGVVYAAAADPLRVVAVDAGIGDVLWKAVGAPDLDRSRAIAAPVLSGRRLFLATRELGSRGKPPGQVLAFDLPGRATRWVRGQGVALSAALGRDGLLTAREDDPMRMRSPADGSVRWSRWLGRWPVSPAIRDGRVYVAKAGGIRDNHVVALDGATGRELWRAPLGMWNVPTQATAVGPHTVHVPWVDFEGAGGGLAAFDLETGRRLWNLRIDGYPTAPVITNGVVVVAVTEAIPVPGCECAEVGRHGRIMAFDARTGVRLWTGRAPGPFVARPVIAGGRLFAVSRAGTVYAFGTGA